MNWTGGARKRISLHEEKKIQKEFFEKKRRSKILQNVSSQASNNSRARQSKKITGSQDLAAIITIDHLFPPTSNFNKESRSPQLVRKVDLSGYKSVVNRVNRPGTENRVKQIELPDSPIPTPSVLQLSSSSLDQNSPLNWKDSCDEEKRNIDKKSLFSYHVKQENVPPKKRPSQGYLSDYNPIGKSFKSEDRPRNPQKPGASGVHDNQWNHQSSHKHGDHLWANEDFQKIPLREFRRNIAPAPDIHRKEQDAMSTPIGQSSKRILPPNSDVFQIAPITKLETSSRKEEFRPYSEPHKAKNFQFHEQRSREDSFSCEFTNSQNHKAKNFPIHVPAYRGDSFSCKFTNSQNHTISSRKEEFMPYSEPQQNRNFPIHEQRRREETSCHEFTPYSEPQKAKNFSIHGPAQRGDSFSCKFAKSPNHTISSRKEEFMPYSEPQKAKNFSIHAPAHKQDSFSCEFMNSQNHKAKNFSIHAPKSPNHTISSRKEEFMPYSEPKFTNSKNHKNSKVNLLTPVKPSDLFLTENFFKSSKQDKRESSDLFTADDRPMKKHRFNFNSESFDSNASCMGFYSAQKFKPTLSDVSKEKSLDTEDFRYKAQNPGPLDSSKKFNDKQQSLEDSLTEDFRYKAQNQRLLDSRQHTNSHSMPNEGFSDNVKKFRSSQKSLTNIFNSMKREDDTKIARTPAEYQSCPDYGFLSTFPEDNQAELKEKDRKDRLSETKKKEMKEDIDELKQSQQENDESDEDDYLEESPTGHLKQSSSKLNRSASTSKVTTPALSRATTPVLSRLTTPVLSRATTPVISKVFTPALSRVTTPVLSSDTERRTTVSTALESIVHNAVMTESKTNISSPPEFIPFLQNPASQDKYIASNSSFCGDDNRESRKVESFNSNKSFCENFSKQQRQPVQSIGNCDSKDVNNSSDKILQSQDGGKGTTEYISLDAQNMADKDVNNSSYKIIQSQDEVKGTTEPNMAEKKKRPRTIGSSDTKQQQEVIKEICLSSSQEGISSQIYRKSCPIQKEIDGHENKLEMGSETKAKSINLDKSDQSSETSILKMTKSRSVILDNRDQCSETRILADSKLLEKDINIQPSIPVVCNTSESNKHFYNEHQPTEISFKNGSIQTKTLQNNCNELTDSVKTLKATTSRPTTPLATTPRPMFLSSHNLLFANKDAVLLTSQNKSESSVTPKTDKSKPIYTISDVPNYLGCSKSTVKCLESPKTLLNKSASNDLGAGQVSLNSSNGVSGQMVKVSKEFDHPVSEDFNHPVRAGFDHSMKEAEFDHSMKAEEFDHSMKAADFEHSIKAADFEQHVRADFDHPVSDDFNHSMKAVDVVEPQRKAVSSCDSQLDNSVSCLNTKSTESNTPMDTSEVYTIKGISDKAQSLQNQNYLSSPNGVIYPQILYKTQTTQTEFCCQKVDKASSPIVIQNEQVTTVDAGVQWESLDSGINRSFVPPSLELCTNKDYNSEIYFHTSSKHVEEFQIETISNSQDSLIAASSTPATENPSNNPYSLRLRSRHKCELS